MVKIHTFSHYIDEDSAYLRVGLILKFIIFLIISAFALINKNIILNLAAIIVISSLAFGTGYFNYNKKAIYFPIYTSLIFSAFWIFLSRIDGGVTYLRFPWSTFVTENTIRMLFLAVSRWVLIYLAGIFLLIVTTEEDLVKALVKLKCHKEAILTITIAFNTVGFAIKDYEIVKTALDSRGYPRKGLMNKIRKIYYLGGTMVLINLKKIELLNQAYFLRKR